MMQEYLVANKFFFSHSSRNHQVYVKPLIDEQSDVNLGKPFSQAHAFIDAAIAQIRRTD
jgi:hypothetical protein